MNFFNNVILKESAKGVPLPEKVEEFYIE